MCCDVLGPVESTLILALRPQKNKNGNDFSLTGLVFQSKISRVKGISIFRRSFDTPECGPCHYPICCCLLALAWYALMWPLT